MSSQTSFSIITDGAFSVGQCVTDSFTVAAPGAHGSPAICGTNTGYHSKYQCISIISL